MTTLTVCRVYMNTYLLTCLLKQAPRFAVRWRLLADDIIEDSD